MTTWPQWTLIALALLRLLVSATNHRPDKVPPVLALSWLLWMGGFFEPILR